MKKVIILISSIVVGVLVALTYFVFEASVRNSTNYIWNTVFDTENKRLIVIPLTVILGMLYFSTQHLLDKKAEKTKSEGLGGMPKPTFHNFLVVLFLGFLSLLAGASLGPEAVLVPACLIIGGLVGKSVSKNDSAIIKLLSAAGFIALFVAFFNSLLAAGLGLFLLKMESSKQKSDTAINPIILIVAGVASVSTYVTLQIIEAPALFSLPPHHWNVSILSALMFIVLIASGIAYIHFLKIIEKAIDKFKILSFKNDWWKRALFASLGLALIFIIGGPLVEFTGNESIAPMFEQAPTLGFIGLLWIIVAKSLAISWSKNLGYRGGLIFPTILVAATMVAIAQIIIPEISVPMGIIAVLTGALYVNNKTHTLF